MNCNQGALCKHLYKDEPQDPRIIPGCRCKKYGILLDEDHITGGIKAYDKCSGPEYETGGQRIIQKYKGDERETFASAYAQQTISDLMDERDGRKIRIQKLQTALDRSTECIVDLRDELKLVATERDELLKEKEAAEYTRKDYQEQQADLAHSSGEGRR